MTIGFALSKGETGSGKTTRLPAILHDADDTCSVAIGEHRVLAAEALERELSAQGLSNGRRDGCSELLSQSQRDRAKTGP